MPPILTSTSVHSTVLTVLECPRTFYSTMVHQEHQRTIHINMEKATDNQSDIGELWQTNTKKPGTLALESSSPIKDLTWVATVDNGFILLSASKARLVTLYTLQVYSQRIAHLWNVPLVIFNRPWVEFSTTFHSQFHWIMRSFDHKKTPSFSPLTLNGPKSRAFFLFICVADKKDYMLVVFSTVTATLTGLPSPHHFSSKHFKSLRIDSKWEDKHLLDKFDSGHSSGSFFYATAGNI